MATWGTGTQLTRARAAAALCAAVWACGVAAQAGIYTCVDAKGRRLTSDRPIAECNDREQKELTATGTVKRTVKPVMTAEEAAREEARLKAEHEERSRVNEERRKDKALLSRYPDKSRHDKERAANLQAVDDVTRAAQKRIAELDKQRVGIDSEMEFYRKDPTKAPATLKRQVEENDANTAEQRRFIAGQDAEKARVNARFDEELVKLRPLWVGQPLAVARRAASAPDSAPAKP